MKKHFKTTIKLLITIGIFVYIFKKYDLKFWDIFSNVQWFPFVVAGVFLRVFVMPAIAMNRWKLFLKHSGIEESILTLAKISFMSSFWGIVLPSSQGGDVMRMYFIEKRHKNADNAKTSSSSVIIERMIGFVLLALIGLISSILIPSFPNQLQIVAIIGIINIAILGGVFFLTNKKCYLLLSNILAKINFLKKLTAFIQKTHYSTSTFPYKQVLLPSVILILMLQFCTIIIAYLVFLSFGITIPLYQHMAFYPIICILSIVPIAISGLGLREGFFVYFYSLVGVSPEIAVGVSLVNYAVEVLSAAVMGGVINLLVTLKLMKI